MPTRSKAQYRLMKAVESGSLKLKGLTKKEAREFTKNQEYSELPEKTTKKFSKLKKLMKG